MIQIFLATALIGVGLSFGKLYLFHISFLLISLSIPFLNIKFRINNKPSFIFLFPFLMFAFYALSILWAENTFYAIQYLIYLFFGLSIIYYSLIFIQNDKSLLQVLKILGGVFLIELIICLLESYTSFRYPISPYSDYITYFAHEFKIDPLLGDDIKKMILSNPTGFHWNPNNLATAFAILLPFLLFHKNALIKWGGTILTLVVIYNSNSRGVLIAAILMLVYFFVTNLKVKYILFGVFISICFLLIPNDLFKINSIKTKLYGSSNAVYSLIFESKDVNNSIGARQKLMKNALTELNQVHWLGVGGGNSKYIQEKRGKVAGKLTSLHNFWLEVLVDAGIFLFIGFLAWYILILKKLNALEYSKNSNISYLAKSTKLSLLGVIVSAVSCSSIIYFFPFWILIGLSFVVINLNDFH